VFGVDVTLGLSKAERLLYGESLMTHAMVFTGVTFDVSNLYLLSRSYTFTVQCYIVTVLGRELQL
jgi:aminopeptidase C